MLSTGVEWTLYEETQHERSVCDRLQIDPGERTLGQLLQEREGAVQGIGRLRLEILRLTQSAAVRRQAQHRRTKNQNRKCRQRDTLPEGGSAWASLVGVARGRRSGLAHISGGMTNNGGPRPSKALILQCMLTLARRACLNTRLQTAR